jgi:uncharacterized membrane protein YqjE
VAVTDYDQLSLGELGRRLTETVTELVQKEIQLGKQELREDIRQNIRAIIWLAIGGVLLLFAVICLLISITALTGMVLGAPVGGHAAGAAIWLVLFAIAGVICLLVGKRQLNLHPLGTTRSELKETVEWAKLRLTPPAK